MMKTKLILSAVLALFAITSFAQNKALHFSKLQQYLPDKIAGYSLSSEKDGASVDMGTTSYSSAEAYYKKGNSELHITLVDYAQAHNIFMAQTGLWQQGLSIDTNDQKTSTTNVAGHKGWQVYQKKENNSELLLGVHNRYVVSLTVSNEKMDVAKAIAELLALSTLPQ